MRRHHRHSCPPRQFAVPHLRMSITLSFAFETTRNETPSCVQSDPCESRIWTLEPLPALIRLRTVPVETSPCVPSSDQNHHSSAPQECPSTLHRHVPRYLFPNVDEMQCIQLRASGAGERASKNYVTTGAQNGARSDLGSLGVRRTADDMTSDWPCFC